MGYDEKTREELVAELDSLRRSAGAGSVRSDARAEEDEARRECEDRYRIVSGLLSDCAYSFSVGPDGKPTGELVAEGLTSLTGYSLADLREIGGWQHLLHPDDRSVGLDQLGRLLNGESCVVDYRIVRKDGAERWVRDYARPMREGGRVTWVCGAVQEVTDRKKAEDALRESEERYRVVSSLISDFAYAFAVAPDGALAREWVTGAIEEMTGYTVAEFMAHETWSPVCHPDDKPEVDRQLRVLLDGWPAAVDFRMVRKDGSTRWVRDYARAEKDPSSGRVVRIYGAVQDISQRKEAEEVQSVLLNVSQAVSESDNLENLLASIHRELGRLIDTTNFYVALYHEDTDKYSFPYHVDEFDDNEELAPAPLKKSLTDYVRRLGRAQMIDESAFQELVDAGEVELIGAPSAIWLGVPLKTGGKVIGVVVVQSYQESSPYSESDFQVMMFVSGQHRDGHRTEAGARGQRAA